MMFLMMKTGVFKAYGCFIFSCFTWNDSSFIIFLMGTGGPGVNPLLSGSYCLVWVLIPDCLSLFSFPYIFCPSPYLAICNSWRWSVHMLWKFLFLSLKTSYEFPNEMFFFHLFTSKYKIYIYTEITKTDYMVHA